MTDRLNKVDLGRLAAEKGWTPEQLRKCYDGEKITLPPNTPIIRYPKEYMEDVLLNKPVADVEAEYKKLEKTFSEFIAQVTVADKEKSPHRQSSPSMSQTVSKRTTTTNTTPHKTAVNE